MSDTEPTDIPTAEMIGPYTLLDELGRGGMGTVYKATSPEGGTVAVKVANHSSPDPTAAIRFAREASLTIDHPNLVKVLDSGVSDKCPYVVFEYLEGETVQELIAKGPMSPADVIDLGLQLCRGLSVAHSAGIVHRDIKPGNIIRRTDGTYVLLDFGLAVWNTDETRMTAHGNVIGTPAYLSPEQARGEIDIDQTADIWSLAVVLFEAASGLSPFQREAMLATVLAVVMDEPPSLGTVCRTVTPELQRAVMGALVKDRDERWQSAEEFANALVEVLPEEPQRLVGTFSGEHSLSEGERRLVAVLLAEDCENPLILGHAVEERGGVFIVLRGQQGGGESRAVGIFGGLSSQGDELIRATQVALDNRQHAERIAVASGHAMGRRSVVSGETLAQAERASHQDVPGVAVDPASARALAGFFEIKIHDDTHMVVGTRDRFGSDSLQIGRDLEQARLTELVDACIDEQRPYKGLICGGRGIGKSTLVHNAERAIRQDFDEALILRARADGIGSTQAYSLIANLLREHFISQQRLAQVSNVMSIDYHSVESAMDFMEHSAQIRCAEFIADLIGVETKSSPQLEAAMADPRLRRDQLRFAVRDYLGGIAAQRPLVLVIEDLHWADSASIELLRDVLADLGEMPIAVIGTALPENESNYEALFDGDELVRIDLRPLRKSQIKKLASAIAGRNLPDEFTSALVTRSAGNPLFVEHLVQDYLDHGAESFEALSMPPTVEAAVQSNLDNLGNAAKELCKQGALLNRDITVEALEALGVEEPNTLLDMVCRRGVLARASSGKQTVYRFRNSLVRDVAYGMLLQGQRKKSHKAAAQFLSVREPSASQEIAQHFELADSKTDAAFWYAKATKEASARGDTDAVMRCSERVLELFPSSADFDLYMARSDAMRFSGKREEQRSELDAALRLAETAAQKARASTELAWNLTSTQNAADAVKVAENAVMYGRESGDSECLALALAWRAVVLAQMGQVDDANHDLREAQSIAAKSNANVQALVVGLRAQVAGMCGDLAERLSAFEAAERLFKETGDLRRAVGAACNVADIYNRLGAYERAEPALEQARETCRQVNNRLAEGYATVNLGYALMKQKRTSEALAEFDAALRLANEANETILQVVSTLYKCRAQLGIVPDNEVANSAQHAARAAEDAGLEPWSAIGLGIAADALLRAGKTAVALTLAKRAMDIRNQLGGLEEDEAELFLVLARAHEQSGSPNEAQRVLALGAQRVSEVAETIADDELRTTYLSVDVRQQLISALEP